VTLEVLMEHKLKLRWDVMEVKLQPVLRWILKKHTVTAQP
jgi:hypothetical protein